MKFSSDCWKVKLCFYLEISPVLIALLQIIFPLPFFTTREMLRTVNLADYDLLEM